MRDGGASWCVRPRSTSSTTRRASQSGSTGTSGGRPIAAFGNSDGDLQMLQWTTTGEGPRFGLIVHHTDAAREWAYDRESRIGRLDEALDEAKSSGWTVLDMARDWRVVYAPSTP